MNNAPLISVIIPTYNRGSLIKRSAESVLNQTYKNLELIIIDDGSTDNTKEVINSLNDKRIVYIYQTNSGAAAARNKGIENAKGNYIAFQDSDDIWHSDKLEKQFLALKENNADIVFCKLSVKGLFKKKSIPKQYKKGFLKKNILPFQISTQTLFCKRELLTDYKFDKEAEPIEDFELLLNLTQKYSIYCTNTAMVDYYIQTDSISNNLEKQVRGWKTIITKHEKFLKDNPQKSELIAAVTIYLAFKVTDKQTRSNLLDIAFTFNKSNKIKFRYYLHKFYFYKTRELIYKILSKIIKKIITLSK